MSTQKIVGIVLLVVGLILLYFGWQSTGGFAEEVHEAFTGRYTDETMRYLIGGGAAAVVGLALLAFGKK